MILDKLYDNFQRIDKKENMNIVNTKKINFTYGEILQEGVTMICDEKHLNIYNAKKVLDFGSGLGKVCVQIFLNYPGVKEIIGFELYKPRFDISLNILGKLHDNIIVNNSITDDKGRSLSFMYQNFLDTDTVLKDADVVIIQTIINRPALKNLEKCINKLKKKCRILTLTYLNIHRFKMLHLDRISKIPTSWAKKGCKMFFYTKL